MLLERNQHLHNLKTHVESIDNGSGKIVLVTGEAGIGKTTLLENFHKEIVNHLGSNYILAWGGSDPLFTPRALGPLHDMARSFNPEIAKLIKDNKDSGKLFDSLLDFLKDNNKKYILVFEDVHWADHATLDLLKFLGRRISFLNCLIIISFRSDEILNNQALKQVLAALPAQKLERIELQPLSHDSVTKLAHEKGIDQNLDTLYRTTGGNPFFVTELLATKKISQLNVPASVRDAISARLNSLDKSEQELLETISLIPKTVPIVLLKELFPENAETYVMSCVGRGLLTVVDNDSFRFRHELSRLGTLERLSAFEKKRIHEKILKSLLKLEMNQEIDLLVHHASGALDAEKVLQFAPVAAKAASESGSHREAASHLATALRFIDKASAEQAALLYETWAFESGLAIGIDDDVIEARRQAVLMWRALGNKVKVGENLRWLSRMLWYHGRAAEAWRYADEAVSVLEDSPPSSERAMAYSLRSQFHMLNDRMDESVLWGEKALELEKKFPDVKVRVHALNNIGTARAFRGDETGVKNLFESLELSIENSLHVDAARVYTNLSEYAVKYKNFALAEDTIANGIAFDTKHDLDSWTYYLVGRLAELRLLQGRLSEAKTIGEGVLELKQLTLLMKLPALLVVSRVYAQTKNEKAKDFLDQALSNARATDEVQHIIPARLAMIEFAWLQNNFEYAIEHLEQLYKISENQVDPWAVGEFVIWGKRLGVNLNYPYSSELPIPYQLELHGDITKAASAWEEIGMPYNAATVLSTAHEAKDYELLNKALKLLEPIGATALIAKIKQQAKSLGIENKIEKVKRGPYASAQQHPLGLTKKEQQVFKLMLNGESNSTIAELLSRSQRTVEHHVSSILKKMNVASRMDAMLRVQNEPWLMPQ